VPTPIAVLCASIIGLLAAEGAMWALAGDGNLLVAAMDVLLIVLIASAMKRTAKGSSNLRAVSAIIGLITLVGEAMTWPPDTSSTFMLADFAIQVALVVACAVLFFLLQSRAVSKWYETP
jgi:hypothetical protein